MVKHAVLSSSTHAHTISARSGLMRSTVSVVVQTVSHSTTWRCGLVVLAWMGSRAGCMGLHLGARYDEHRDAQLHHDAAELRVHQAGEPRVGVRHGVRPFGLLIDGDRVDRQGELDTEATQVDQAEQDEPLVQREAAAAILRLDEVVQWRHSLHGPALEARLVRVGVVLSRAGLARESGRSIFSLLGWGSSPVRRTANITASQKLTTRPGVIPTL